MSNIRKMSLGEICEITSSTRIFANEYKMQGVPFYRSKEIIELANGKIDVSEKFFISKKRFDKIKCKRAVPVMGDILLAAIGANLGEAFLVNVDYDFYFKDGNVIWFRDFSKKVRSEYIYYWMKSNDFKYQYNNNSIGAAQKALTIDSLKKYKIDIPSIKVQDKIISILKQIDIKISNNNKIDTKLEQIIKTIYDYYFLQYEFPNEEGKPYKSSGGKLVWNKELGKKIPKGWKVENIINNSISKVIVPGIELFNSKKNYLATANVNNSEIQDGEWITYNNRASRANMQPKADSVWFAKMKNSIKHITFTKSSNKFINKYILSTGFLGIDCEKYALSYIHSFIYSDNFEKQKDILAHGATQEAVNNQDLENIKLIIPNINILKKFTDNVYNLLEMQNIIMDENQQLQKLKKFLLPLLINGQIK